jgi:hypothetical protein
MRIFVFTAAYPSLSPHLSSPLVTGAMLTNGYVHIAQALRYLLPGATSDSRRPEVRDLRGKALRLSIMHVNDMLQPALGRSLLYTERVGISANSEDIE